MDENIYLIGFMGSGKTTLGKEIAAKLQYQWIDLDHYIEAEHHMKVSVLFEKFGENYFRSLEVSSLRDVTCKKSQVISTGGGIVVTPENVSLLKQQRTFYLKWDFDTLFQRVGQDKDRPLVKSYQQLKGLYEERGSLYESACFETIDCEGKTIDRKSVV